MAYFCVSLDWYRPFCIARLISAELVDIKNVFTSVIINCFYSSDLSRELTMDVPNLQELQLLMPSLSATMTWTASPASLSFTRPLVLDGLFIHVRVN
jgi:hypothetical protein